MEIASVAELDPGYFRLTMVEFTVEQVTCGGSELDDNSTFAAAVTGRASMDSSNALSELLDPLSEPERILQRTNWWSSSNRM